MITVSSYKSYMFHVRFISTYVLLQQNGFFFESIAIRQERPFSNTVLDSAFHITLISVFE